MKGKLIGILALALICFNNRAAEVVSAGTFDIPIGATAKGPAMPGQSFQFVVEVKPGEILNLPVCLEFLMTGFSAHLPDLIYGNITNPPMPL